MIIRRNIEGTIPAVSSGVAMTVGGSSSIDLLIPEGSYAEINSVNMKLSVLPSGIGGVAGDRTVDREFWFGLKWSESAFVPQNGPSFDDDALGIAVPARKAIGNAVVVNGMVETTVSYDPNVYMDLIERPYVVAPVQLVAYKVSDIFAGDPSMTSFYGVLVIDYEIKKLSIGASVAITSR